MKEPSPKRNNLKLTQSLDRLTKTQEGNFPKKIKILGLDIVVHKNVFSPEFFEDAEVFTPMIEQYMKKNTDFLELGSGTGITSIYASKKIASKTKPFESIPSGITFEVMEIKN